MRRYVLVFFDDILIYSQNMKDHLTHLKNFLKTLQDNKISVKMETCQFRHGQISYLGFLISEKGVSMDLEKMAALNEWP